MLKKNGQNKIPVKFFLLNSTFFSVANLTSEQQVVRPQSCQVHKLHSPCWPYPSIIWLKCFLERGHRQVNMTEKIEAIISQYLVQRFSKEENQGCNTLPFFRRAQSQGNAKETPCHVNPIPVWYVWPPTKIPNWIFNP